MGISFAIPMDEAMRVSEQLRASGRVSRGRIGVQIAPVTKEVAESIGLGKAQGVLVRGVEEGSPAEKAGLEAGDIITRFDGKLIDKPADLPRAVGNTKPGSKVGITVFRRGGHKDLNITVAEIEPEKVAAATSCPILLLGGDPGSNWEDVFAKWENAMKVPNIRGLVPGRALLFGDELDVEAAVARAAQMVRKNG
mgnify:CR=1 FL=1